MVPLSCKKERNCICRFVETACPVLAAAPRGNAHASGSYRHLGTASPMAWRDSPLKLFLPVHSLLCGRVWAQGPSAGQHACGCTTSQYPAPALHFALRCAPVPLAYRRWSTCLKMLLKHDVKMWTPVPLSQLTQILNVGKQPTLWGHLAQGAPRPTPCKAAMRVRTLVKSMATMRFEDSRPSLRSASWTSGSVW